jgi:molybdopterin synthase catalytic subunit
MMSVKKYLIEGPITDAFLASEITSHHTQITTGALACFLGQVRNDLIDGKEVTGIEYSAYEAMVEPAAESIKNQLLEEFSDLKSLKIFHSTGEVPCGGISLLVMVSSGHRKQSFAALEKCVELIKEKLPIWKKEKFSDGTTRWV